MMPGLRAVHDAQDASIRRTAANDAHTSSAAKTSSISSKKLQGDASGMSSSGRKEATKMNGKGKQQHPELELDELPGSLQNATPPETSGVNSPALTSTSGYSTPNGTTRKKRKQLSRTQLKIREKQKQQSNIILSATIAPLAGVLLWQYLEPTRAILSSQDTRIPTYHFPSLANRFLHLSYQIPLSTFASTPSGTTSQQAELAPRYLRGVDDFFFVATWTIAFTLFREVLMRFVCMPFARWGGIRKNSTLVRFAEQGYDVVTHTVGCAYGIYLMQKSEYRNLNLEGMWRGYPHYKLEGDFKAYYLVQCAFWLQQILTLNIEKRRKDYYQMFAHHVITVSLLFLSYTYNFTRVGNVILILMDVCDINLSIAKMLKYFHRERACDVAFVSFMLMWIYTRHILYNRVLLSALYDVPNIIEFAWKPEEEHFLTKEVQTGFVALLAALQVLLIIWFFMIVKVLIAVVSGKNAEDTRSDDEDEDDDGLSSSSQAQTPMASPRQTRDRKER